MYAADYLQAAQAVPPPQAPFEPARYFLACRAIELGLKSFLSLRRIPLSTLAGGTFGHDLEALLARSQELNLSVLVAFSTEDQAEIRAAARYFRDKVFEYPALTESVRGFPGKPDLAVLLTAAQKLVDSLAQPCLHVE
jgi:hypothetical protein